MKATYSHSPTKHPSVCLLQAKLGVFIERNWIVTKSYTENKGQDIDKTKCKKNKRESK